MALGSLLLLLSAFLHASWNALAKSARDKESYLFITMFFSGFLSLASVLVVFPPEPFSHPEVFWFAVASGVFEGLYLFSLAKTLKSSSLGVSYAIMRGGAMVVVWLISLSFLGEVATVGEISGAALVLLGIVAMNAEAFLRVIKKSSVTVHPSQLLSVWPFLSAVFIAGYHVCYHQALDHGAEPRSLFTLSVFVSLPLVFWGVATPRIQNTLATLKNETSSVLATSVISTLSFVIFLYGLKASAPGFAISLRNSSIFFALVFSFFLKENLSRAQIMGATVIASGAILLSIS
ncbi:hypothetical protein AZI86_12490 [Bdellovibrio bacteriovorus]|uniref:EamA domain-containing protein n=1 Tax=Bdellovibrio bacteriovorus TaxID=959 RepID=A0A150WJ41_BDEBC|nr:DMT family transporter [Bdellovibrio bacteriovorus]KYG63643.1 hypothetical protein AZI86_12490 [Bdellovibrio bacteriovorus]